LVKIRKGTLLVVPSLEEADAFELPDRFQVFCAFSA